MPVLYPSGLHAPRKGTLARYTPRVFHGVKSLDSGGPMTTGEWIALANLVDLIARYRHLREVVPLIHVRLEEAA